LAFGHLVFWQNMVWLSSLSRHSFSQRVFESISFWLVKAFGYLAFWQVKFLVVAKVEVVCKNLVSLAAVLFSASESSGQLRLTKRAADKWDAPPFSGSFLASSFFCSRTESTPAHLRLTHTVRRLSSKIIWSFLNQFEF